MATTRALVLTPSTRDVSIRELPRPTPGPGEVLIRVHAIALNPIDSLYVKNPIAEQESRVIGTDFAGEVVQAGPDLSDSNDERTKAGVRVAGFLQGACSTNDRPGAFSQYIVAPYDLIWRLPEGLSFEAASAISMCGLTAAQGVFDRLGLPGPFSPGDSFPLSDRGADSPINVLIYGASTSLGLYAAQFVNASAKITGRKIRLIGAASASKHDMLRQEPYSYDVLVDYRDEDWTSKVHEVTGGDGVDYAVDCISEGVTVDKVNSTLGAKARMAVFRGPAGGRYNPENYRIKPIYGAVWEGLGMPIGYNGAIIPASPRARVFATKFFNYLGSEAEKGVVKVEANPLRLMPGGLDRVVPDGFALLGGFLVSEREKVQRDEEYMRPISGEKMVYVVE
ncbi:chaperonin 10-like protein [Mariannaea sp. PMI_226]|nr:chaperonin 10-like protein [Mariannaea sp. PMI_226]